MIESPEELTFTVDNATIIRLLGNQNFSNKNTAILELVKNSYDAFAESVSIIFSKDKITIQDDGDGMSEEDIRKHWMVVGVSSKKYEVKKEDGRKRVLSGSMGIGRFALSKLGRNVEINTKKDGHSPIKWTTDWDKNILIPLLGDIEKGTTITITSLNDHWGRKEVQDLIDYLQKVCRQSDMEMIVSYDDKEPISKVLTNYYSKPVLGKSCTEIIRLHYDSKLMELTGNIDSDEFLPEAQQYCSQDIHSHIIKINTFEEFKQLYVNREEDLQNFLHNLGSFDAEFCFGLKPIDEDVDRFLYKHRDVGAKLKDVVLYRNAFSINSLDGSTDWLEFGKRSRKSPAAATHVSGNWRVRENQIFGWVQIDKQENRNIKELANRQNVEKDDYFLLLKEILIAGISEFERYRQKIIRDINKKNEALAISEPSKDIINEVIDKKKDLRKLSENESKRLVNAIIESQKSNKDYEQKIKQMEKDHGYETRLLNLLATIGMRAAYIGHELGNRRNNIASSCVYIENTLKKENLWELLSSERLTRISSTNVPKMLQTLKEDTKPIIEFADTMSTNLRKTSFKPEKSHVREYLDKVARVWMENYNYLTITLGCDEDLEYFVSYDVIKTIFDNLILNSIQQSPEGKELTIRINCSIQDDMLALSYKDSGPGLPLKYSTDPRRILRPHETSRENGHGLGMWIVDTTIKSTGGEISIISPGKCFTFAFTLGTNYDNRTY